MVGLRRRRVYFMPLPLIPARTAPTHLFRWMSCCLARSIPHHHPHELPEGTSSAAPLKITIRLRHRTPLSSTLLSSTTVLDPSLLDCSASFRNNPPPPPPLPRWFFGMLGGEDANSSVGAGSCDSRAWYSRVPRYGYWAVVVVGVVPPLLEGLAPSCGGTSSVVIAAGGCWRCWRRRW